MAEAEKKLIEVFASLPARVQREILAMANGAAIALEAQEDADEKKPA